MRKPASGIARNACRLFLLALTVWAASLVFAAAEPAGRIAVVTVHDIISPATAEFLLHAIDRAQQNGSPLLVIRMDTPGGLDTSMRSIIQAILASPVPVVTFVHPEGARAASAGTYILYASHIAAMTPATNLGAATPVALSGGGNTRPTENAEPISGAPDKSATPATLPPKKPLDAASAKAINDAAAYLRSLAELRGRNIDFAERAVREAASLSAQEALENSVIDLVAADMPDLLKQLDGREIQLAGGPVTLSTSDAEIVYHEPGLRHRILALIANPQIALILMMFGVYGLFYEFTSPGFGIPGVAGAICMIVALYSLHMMPVNWAGILLLLLGIGLMITEALVPSFGIVGIGGIIAFVVGGLFLTDGHTPGFDPSAASLVAIAMSSAVILFFIGSLATQSQRRPVVSGREEMTGRRVTVIALRNDGTYWVNFDGERWRAESGTPLTPGQEARIERIDGLTLHLSPAVAATQTAAGSGAVSRSA